MVDGSTLYLQPGAVIAELIPGKSWVSATADDLGSNGTPTGFAVAPTLLLQLVGQPGDDAPAARGQRRHHAPDGLA